MHCRAVRWPDRFPAIAQDAFPKRGPSPGFQTKIRCFQMRVEAAKAPDHAREPAGTTGRPRFPAHGKGYFDHSIR
jgi:hypothetical protein